MAVETAEDLAAMFHPDDFGVPMVAHTVDASLPFSGVPTTGYAAERPGTAADVSMMVPRIIATKASLPELQQNDEIEMPSGQRVIVNDVQYKGELIIIHYHEHW
jgi:hypothetical protein